MRISTMTAALFLAMSMSQVHALNVKSTAHTPKQVGQTNQVQVGLAVQGWTNNQYLTVAGAFKVACPGGLPIEAQKAASSSQLKAGFSFTLTIPGAIPVQYEIPGWQEWAAPSTKSCTFVYTGRAKEALVSLSGFGIGISLGGGEAVDGDTKVFTMVKPVPGTGGGTCIPQEDSR